MIHNFEKNIFKTSKKLKAGNLAGLYCKILITHLWVISEFRIPDKALSEMHWLPLQRISHSHCPNVMSDLGTFPR